jgi:signal transduction histidine kinase
MGLGVWLEGRLQRLADSAGALAAGHQTARAIESNTDVIGATGAALNTYATYTQTKLDDLRTQIRARRQEVTQLVAALMSLPEGVVVQDLGGQVLVMNAPARRILGASLSATDITALTAIVTDKLGEALAPGIYALGDPLRVDLGERVIQSQIAAVMTNEDIRIGTIIMLRDITASARHDRTRTTLIDQLDEVIDVLPPDYADPLRGWVKKMRDLDSTDNLTLLREDGVFTVDSLVWSVVNEWQQIAKNHHIELQVEMKVRGLNAHGDAKRLSWALGAVLDNAIKYTPAGGQVMIQVRDPEDGMFVIRVRDDGVGIKREELGKVLTRFYRGTPEMPDGRLVRVPGMGQGLALTKQIVESHGGAVEIKSRPGSGTAVYVRLPLHKDSA